MDNLPSLSFEQAKEFLEKVVAPNYHTYADFQNWAEKYTGEFEDYLKKVGDYFEYRNNKCGNRFYPPLLKGDITDILNETITKKSITSNPPKFS